MLEIDLHYLEKRRELIDPIIRVKNILFEQHDIKINDKKEECPTKGNIIIAQQQFLNTSILDSSSPLILIERHDSATINHRELLSHKNILKVWKLSKLKNSDNQNLSESYHVSLLNQKFYKPRMELTNKSLSKIEILWNYAPCNRMIAFKDTKLKTPKKTDINFVGKTSYHIPEIRTHRKHAIKILNSLNYKKIIKTKKIEYQDYLKSLVKSKIVVSPWGYGEICYRDVEAIYTGCILVKPDISFVDTWPPIYYFPCKHDWSNLIDVIQQILDSWNTLEEFRYKNRENLLRCLNENLLAQRVADLINTSLKNFKI